VEVRRVDEGRRGPELIRATRAFADEDPVETWKQYLATIIVAASCFAVAASSALGPLALVGSVALGLVNVRLFIFYHDGLHGAIFRHSRIGKALLKIYGYLILCPDRIWRDSHNYHHAHTSKLVGASIGSFPLMTVRMYSESTPIQRLRYRIARHWLTMLLGYVTVFGFGMCVGPFVRNPRRYACCAGALIVHVLLTLLLAMLGGAGLALRAYVLPLGISCALGSYLFYAQHTFSGMELRSRVDWEYTTAALRSSSMMTMGRVMRWFTGNIGYHHVHHVNSLIPFYRLPDAMAGVPELADPRTTSLHPREVRRCLELHLWEPNEGTMLSFREARGRAITS
jgi:omega-6 fatty acid desaturase (delta-12 desaturase)